MRAVGDPLAELDRWVSPSERRRFEEVASAMAVLREGGLPALTWLLRELPSLIDCQRTTAYCLVPEADGWSLDYYLWDGAPWGARAQGCFEEALREIPSLPTSYDPSRPPASQRNKPMRSKTLVSPAAFARTAAGHAERKMGVAKMDELRVLVCDGPALLSWVGGWRDEPFGSREVALLRALIPALRSRLKLERQLGISRASQAALAATLEALPNAAFIVRRNGRIEHANTAGEALAEQGQFALRRALCEAIAGPASPSRFHVAPVVENGVARRFLVRLVGTESFIAARCAHFAARWQLTPRQAATLRLVVAGDSNKTIATKLGCALRTVELHVSALLAKSRTERRSELTARFWSGD